MTRDDVIRMAREAGFTVGLGSPALEKHERFADLVAAAAKAEEREACANLVDRLEVLGYRGIARGIRARGTE